MSRAREIELENTLNELRLKLFYIGNLATNAWHDLPTIEPICRRIKSYAEDGQKQADVVLRKP